METANQPLPLPDLPGMNLSGRKVCYGRCGQQLPATTEYFDKDSRKADGLRGICKDCRKHQSQMRKAKDANERIEQIDKQLLSMLNKATLGGNNVPHTAEMYEKIVTLLGGSQGVAISWVGQYLAAPAGSQQRERMLASLMKLGQHVTDTGVARVPVDMLTDEDLQRELEAVVARRQGPAIEGTVLTPGTVVNRDEFDPTEDEYDDDFQGNDDDTDVDDDD